MASSDPVKYVCEMCHEEFESGWTEEEALTEAAANGFDVKECGLVCDECYQKTPWGDPVEKERERNEMEFTDYRAARRGVFTLEEEVTRRATELQVAPEDYRAIMAMLAPLGAKRNGGNYHRNHSLRVGMLASEIAEHVSFGHPKALFFAGLLHDVGKALVPMCTLCATEKWTEEDRRAMEPHVMDGFRMLRDRFDFTAHVIARHHKTQSGGYPIELPRLPNWSERTSELIEFYARILTIADVFDAMHRVNSGSGGVALSEEQIKERMMKIDPLVEELYAKGALVFAVSTK